MIRILVINKRSIFMNTLIRVSPVRGIEFIGICEEPLAAVKLCSTLKPDIVMVDVTFEQEVYGISTQELICQLRDASPGVKLIAVSTFYEAWLKNFLTANAFDGYFYRNAANACECLINCIHKVYNGELYYLSE